MNKRDLYHLTRQVDFLWKSTLVLAVVFVLLGMGIGSLNTGRLDSYQRIVSVPRYVDEFTEELDGDYTRPAHNTAVADAVRDMLASPAPFHEKLENIRFLLYFAAPDDRVSVPVATELPNLSGKEHAVASAFVAAASGEKNEAALVALAGGDAPVAHANYALALLRESRQENSKSIAALKREIEFHNSDPARRRLVNTYLDAKQFNELEKLISDPEYKPFISSFVLREVALSRMDWPALVKAHFRSAYEGTNLAMAVLALLSGLVWATILFRFNGSLSVLKLAVPALLLGALSTHATLLFIYWQEYQLGFTMGQETVGQIVYCILGIGLREEAMKLLLFVPLIPFLLKRTDLEILTIAGLVGLGFAIEENINYFESTAGVSALGRFATANFLHIALTAMCGLTLTRAVAHRGEEIQHALTTFVSAVAIHGLYDAFIMVPAVEDYSFLSSTVFVLMAYQYFGWLRHLREEWRDPVSITSVFTLGVLLVTGISFCLYAWKAGPYPALQAIGYEAIGVGIILILFYREIPETLE
ncbi:hypothetical protein PDESU_05609 [Pontiella desulfatans]|uniref:Protease PrsW n=1 Tax=Pontiella desulfatans TaxID=2750659 RepID=A0A6C2UAI4_PONDE|nr:PrsW family glutamic-type intramembrane protease [Pontiella desulfatans]VGO17015.1 hypothetical protein PDESU_05609 [Pontiella desulfatans]